MVDVRPSYETSEDREREQAIVLAVCAAWRCEAQAAPRFYQHDYFLTRGEDMVAVVEVKARTNPHDQYRTYMLSAHKYLHGVAWEGSLQVPFLLVVGFTDGVWFCRPRKCRTFVRFGGRRDRGDAQDMEAVVHVPMEEFKRLNP